MVAAVLEYEQTIFLTFDFKEYFRWCARRQTKERLDEDLLEAPKSRSWKMPQPARNEVLPFLKGSHAAPTRGSKSCQSLLYRGGRLCSFCPAIVEVNGAGPLGSAKSVESKNRALQPDILIVFFVGELLPTLSFLQPPGMSLRNGKVI
jgi:hypothetical protein